MPIEIKYTDDSIGIIFCAIGRVTASDIIRKQKEIYRSRKLDKRRTQQNRTNQERSRPFRGGSIVDRRGWTQDHVAHIFPFRFVVNGTIATSSISGGGEMPSWGSAFPGKAAWTPMGGKNFVHWVLHIALHDVYLFLYTVFQMRLP